jgi:hypothetical protein
MSAVERTGNPVAQWAMDTDRSTRLFLRHTLATLAYRGGKALRGAPASFGSFRAGPSSRSAGEILGHVGDLLDWALVYAAEGRHSWREAPLGSWDEDTARFFAGLAAFDTFLASEAPIGLPAEQLFQGPIADALTHVGQITMLRRLAGVPVRGENYLRADIAAGRVGADQSAPRREFD